MCVDTLFFVVWLRGSQTALQRLSLMENVNKSFFVPKNNYIDSDFMKSTIDRIAKIFLEAKEKFLQSNSADPEIHTIVNCDIEDHFINGKYYGIKQCIGLIETEKLNKLANANLDDCFAKAEIIINIAGIDQAVFSSNNKDIDNTIH